MNNIMNYHLSSGVKQFADGTTIHTRIEITRGIENNADKWFIAYWINGRGYQYELHAGYGARYHHLYARGIENAVMSAKMRIDRAIDKIHAPEVWVCPKPTPSPVAIILYGSLYAPVTLKVQKTSEPVTADDAYRQRLHNEMVTLQSVTYSPMGAGLPRWKAIAIFDNKEVRFPIFSEHAIKFIHAGHGALPKYPIVTHFNTDLNVVLEWNEPHHDLRIAAVIDKDGKPHKVGEGIAPLPVAAPTEDTRTPLQKRLGVGSPYAGFDFKQYDKGYKKTG